MVIDEIYHISKQIGFFQLKSSMNSTSPVPNLEWYAYCSYKASIPVKVGL